MEFRPCIDIHNGKVKQIVGSTISDLWKENGRPKENFVADKDAAYYANLYRQDGDTLSTLIKRELRNTRHRKKRL